MINPASDTEEPATPVSPSQVANALASEYKGLVGLIQLKLKDRELASDLLNEAIVLTLEHARQGRLTRPDQIGGYVFTISMNLLRNHHRNFDNRRELRGEVEMLQGLGVCDRDDMELSQLRAKALELIEALPTARDKEVVKRFYLDEEDKESLCKDLNLTPLQFSQIMSRARKRIREAFDSFGLLRSDYLSVMFL